MNNCVICAIAKNENAYLYEWAEYHLSLGFSHIYVYDNNDVDGERVDDVFANTEIVSKISVFDVRGEKFVQKKVYNEFYAKACFDWCAFIDIDEFITLRKLKSILEYLSSKSSWDSVHLNWMCFGDGGKVRYEQSSVASRFASPWKRDVYYSYTDKQENSHIKSIIKSGLDIDWAYDGDGWESNPHTPYGEFSVCDSSGTASANFPFSPICYDEAYIRHYTTKTIEEYANKVSRQCADCDAQFYSFTKFFRVNRLTLRKLIWLKRHYPQVRIWACVKERFKYIIVNNNLPFRFLFRSLRK